MSFLSAVVTSRYLTTNNQPRNSSNPRQQATINDGRVTLQPVQRRQVSFVTGTTRTYTPGASRSDSRKKRTVICYNCKGEGHMSKQCTKPKRKQDDAWFKDKVLLSGVVNHSEIEITSDSNIIPYSQENSVSNQSALNFDQYFKLNVLKAQSQEKDTFITKLKERIKSLSGDMNEDKVKKDIDEIETINIELDHSVSKLIGTRVDHSSPRLMNNRAAHSDYLKLTQEQAAILRKIVKHGKSQNPLNNSLDSACNTKKDRIQRPPNNTQKNKVEAHPKNDKSSLKNKNCAVEQKETATVHHSKLNANSKLIRVKCNGCMLSDNHDLCVLNVIHDVNACPKSVKKNSKRKVWKPTSKVFTKTGYTWRPTGRTFTIVGNACPLTRITTPTEVPLRKPTVLETDTPKPVVTLVYSRKPRRSKTSVPVSIHEIIKSISANNKEPSKSWESIVSDVPSFSLDECRKRLFQRLRLLSKVYIPKLPTQGAWGESWGRCTVKGEMAGKSGVGNLTGLTGVQVNAAHSKTIMNAARPMSYLSKTTHSTVKKTIQKNTSFKNSNINKRVNTVRGKKFNTARPKAVVNVVKGNNFNSARLKAVVNAIKGNNFNAVKASACWVWKLKTKVLDHVSKHNSASFTLKKFDYVDVQGRS
nr:hypothetical protein [Tanacetum cinerariifolium]